MHLETKSYFVAFLLSTAVGMFAGLINGLLVTKVGIPLNRGNDWYDVLLERASQCHRKRKGISITLVEGTLH